jgi:hypothetical protein|tara:strand:+ start:145 stop:483 length:339 start_codon:yes stop_codon:yes gene_type:complete
MSSTHEQILEKSGKEEPTMKQASTIIGKYKDLLRKGILKKHEALQSAKTSDFPHFAGVRIFALHYLNTFSVANNINRGDASKLIRDAYDGTFDKTWIKPFLDSANSYKKVVK